jgi:hypothetical protein
MWSRLTARAARALSTAALVLLAAAPARGDFALGGQVMQVDRKLEFGSLDMDSESGDALSAFLGWDWKNSMFYIQGSREKAEFSGLGSPYEKSEISLDWHWNETTAKNNFANLSVGVFYTDYRTPFGFDAGFYGLSAGGGFTRFLAGPLFFNTRARARLMFGQENDLFPSAEENPSTAFLGYEAQAAFGLQFGRKASWSIQLGYKAQGVDFEERYIEDLSGQAFLATRFFVPSK